MKCCEHAVQTAYCPHCGKVNPGMDESVVQLLAHVRTQARSQGLRASNIRIPEDDPHDWNKNRARSARDAEAKWTRWAEALADLMAKERRDATD